MRCWRLLVLLFVPIVVSALAGRPALASGSFGVLAPGVHSVAAQLAPYCETSDSPTFDERLVPLKEELGDVMGDPLECAHVDNVSGDTVQRTSTGLAYVRTAAGVPTFTDGANHWALTPMGLVEWDGPSPDPPGAMAPPPPPPVPDTPAVPDIPQPGTDPQTPPIPVAPLIPAIPAIPPIPSVP